MKLLEKFFGQADKKRQQVEEKYRLALLARLNIDQALRLVQQQIGGLVIEAELDVQDEHPVWEFEFITDDGELKAVFLDGNTGAVLKR